LDEIENAGSAAPKDCWWATLTLACAGPPVSSRLPIQAALQRGGRLARLRPEKML